MKQYKLNTNKINTMEDKRTQGNRGGAQRFGLFSFLLRTGRGHPGPRFGLGHTQGGQSKGPWRHLPPPLGPLVLRRGVQLSTPVTNHDNNDDDREMRTNCNQIKKNKKTIQSLMLALIRRLLVGPYYCLFLQSGARWGKDMGGGGRVNLGGERRKGRGCFPGQLFQGWNSTSDPRSRSSSASYRTSSTVSEEPGAEVASMPPGHSAGVSS